VIDSVGGQPTLPEKEVGSVNLSSAVNNNLLVVLEATAKVAPQLNNAVRSRYFDKLSVSRGFRWKMEIARQPPYRAHMLR
jgi:hypothetical protein